MVGSEGQLGEAHAAASAPPGPVTDNQGPPERSEPIVEAGNDGVDILILPPTGGEAEINSGVVEVREPEAQESQKTKDAEHAPFKTMEENETHHAAASKIQRKYRRGKGEKSNERENGKEDDPDEAHKTCPHEEESPEPEESASQEEHEVKEEKAAISIQRSFRSHQKKRPDAPLLEEDEGEKATTGTLESVKTSPGTQRLQPLSRTQIPGTGTTRPRLVIPPKFATSAAGEHYGSPKAHPPSCSRPYGCPHLRFANSVKAAGAPVPVAGDAAVTHWRLRRTAEPRPEYRNESRQKACAVKRARRLKLSQDDPSCTTLYAGHSVEEAATDKEEQAPWYASLPSISTSSHSRQRTARWLYLGGANESWGIRLPPLS